MNLVLLIDLRAPSTRVIWKRRFRSGNALELFSVRTQALEKLEHATIAGDLGLCLRISQAGKSLIIVMSSFFEKLRFQNGFHPNLNTRAAFPNSSGSEERFQKDSVFVMDECERFA